MRRRVVRILIGLAVFATALTVISSFISTIRDYFLNDSASAPTQGTLYSSEYDRTKMFSGKDSDYVIFRLPPTAAEFRISSQLITPTEKITSSPPNTEHSYSIEWSMRDDNSGSPQEVTHVQTSSPQQLPRFGRVDGKPSLSAFPVKSFEVELEERRTHIVRVRAKMQNSAIDDSYVVIRISVKQERSRRKLAYFWQRMRGDKREKLASTSIFGSESLTSKEREALFQNRWTPVGPTGIEGDNFQTTLIYTLREPPLASDIESPDVIPDRESLIVGPNFRAVVPISEPDTYTISLTPTTPSKQIDSITMAIYDKQMRRQSFRWKPLEQNLTTEIFLPYGLVELSTEHQAIMRIQDSEGHFLDAEPSVIRCWDVSKKPVSFGLPDLSILKLIARKGSAKAKSFRITWKSEQKSEAESLPLLDDVSAFDRLIQGVGDFTVWEKSEYVLTPPPWADSISVSAEEPVFVQFFKRPRRMTHKTVVPDDYDLEDLEGKKQPVWFSARPHDYHQRILNGESMLLLTQRRLPEENIDLATGTYHWEEISETPSRQGCYLLIDLLEDEEIREEAKSILYARVPLNQTIGLNQAQSPSAAEFPSRRLIYRKEGESPTTLTFATNLGPLGPPHTCSASRGEIPTYSGLKT